MSETASTGGVHRPESREEGSHRLGGADDPERDPRGDPERALGADDHPEQVGAVRVESCAAELDDLAVGQHEGQRRDVVRREAVLQAVRAARVLGDVAADRAHLLARGIGRVEEAVLRDGTRHVEVRDAGLDDDTLAREVDLEDPIHARERDDDPAGSRRRAAREPGTGAAGHERHPVPGARAKHGLHVLRRAGQDYELGHGSVACQPVALVRSQLLRLGDDVLRAQCASQLVHEGGRKAHAAESRGLMSNSRGRMTATTLRRIATAPRTGF